MRYTDVWNDMTEKIGYWVDMENPYITTNQNIWKRFGGF
jgi:isoleucyl-tRNA synthetase